MVMPNLTKEAAQQYVRPSKSKAVLTKEVKIVTAEAEVKKEQNMNSEISDDDEEDEVREEAVANYDLRSKTGEEKRQVVKPLKWPVLKKWNVKPSKVLEMQKEDSTLDQYWKTAKGYAGVKESNQEDIQLV